MLCRRFKAPGLSSTQIWVPTVSEWELRLDQSVVAFLKYYTQKNKVEWFCSDLLRRWVTLISCLRGSPKPLWNTPTVSCTMSAKAWILLEAHRYVASHVYHYNIKHNITYPANIMRERIWKLNIDEEKGLKRQGRAMIKGSINRGTYE